MGNYALGIGMLRELREGLEGKFKDRLSRAEKIDRSFQGGAIQTAWGRFYELPWPKRDARKSERALESALALNPDNVRARVYLADTYEKGRRREAREQLEKAAAGKPDAMTRQRSGGGRTSPAASSPTRRSTMIAEDELLKKGAPAARNLVALFEAQAKTLAERTAVTMKRDGRWQGVAWSEVARRARDVADGLAAIGLRPGDRVAIIGETNLEWILADLGILGATGITVTIYQSNKASECQYILADSGARFIFCDTDAQVAKIREVRGKLPALEGIIRASGSAADPFERTSRSWSAPASGGAPTPTRTRAGSRRSGPTHRRASSTPGTTGNPKGVILSHGNWVYEAYAVEQLRIIGPDDVVLMFLPMAHLFAKVIEAVWFATGATVAFVESLEKILDNASEVKPTVMPSVPRIFEKAYNTVVSKGLATPGRRASCSSSRSRASSSTRPLPSRERATRRSASRSARSSCSRSSPTR